MNSQAYAAKVQVSLKTSCLHWPWACRLSPWSTRTCRGCRLLAASAPGTSTDSRWPTPSGEECRPTRNDKTTGQSLAKASTRHEPLLVSFSNLSLIIGNMSWISGGSCAQESFCFGFYCSDMRSNNANSALTSAAVVSTQAFICRFCRLYLKTEEKLYSIALDEGNCIYI